MIHLKEPFHLVRLKLYTHHTVTPQFLLRVIAAATSLPPDTGFDDFKYLVYLRSHTLWQTDFIWHHVPWFIQGTACIRLSMLFKGEE